MRIETHKETKQKIKKCEYKGCNTKFLGHPISKYCPYHKDAKNRQKKKQKRKPSVTENNIIIDHECEDITPITLKCALKGCRKEYGIEICPKQYVYPKYCPGHRNKYKREIFLKKQVKTVRRTEKFLKMALINNQVDIPDNVIVNQTKTTFVLTDKDDKNKKLCVSPIERILLSKHISKLSFIEVDEERSKKERMLRHSPKKRPRSRKCMKSEFIWKAKTTPLQSSNHLSLSILIELDPYDMLKLHYDSFGERRSYLDRQGRGHSSPQKDAPRRSTIS